ncbi:MAG TPA: HD domain-containing phosphohydrolase [Kofleriaceae bacterium]|jgi:HD-GYP domain-containing protein (c-di-GMP phosphodiesterase class II)
MISSPDDLVTAISRDRRLAGYKVRRQGEGWIELEVVAQRGRQAAIIVLAWPEVWRNPISLSPHLIRARSGNYALVVVGEESEIEATLDMQPGDTDIIAAVAPIGMTRLLLTLRGRADAIAQRMQAAALELELERSRNENDMMIKIGRALSAERDITKLLAVILKHACEVTNADAGSIYRVYGADDSSELEFTASQNDSRDLPATRFRIPVSTSSISGHCVVTKESINVVDLYRLDEPGTGNNPWGFTHDRSFDDKNRYQTRSVLAVPMISARNEVIGVIQLINKRAKGWIALDLPSDFDDGVVPFDQISETYLFSLASQAGIALENKLLYEEVTTLFDGFVKAAVTAIESRDPTTSGHSERVADLTCGLAEAVDRIDSGRFRDLEFSSDDLVQIRYAALLHDFGKVGVREHVLVKAKKLYEHERELILQRFALIKRGYRIEGLESKVRYLADASREGLAAQLESVDTDIAAKLANLDEIIQFILKANEPTVLDQGGFERITEIARMSFSLDDGAQQFLTHNEACALQIRRGSLTDEERLEINSHVTHSYQFLKAIPWSRTLRDVPSIAGAHHEKLDGSGYPSGLRGESIPVPARMMAISDIFDALTASDRPYKKAMPVDKALDILAGDVKRGQLDSHLYEVFLGARVWQPVIAGRR